MSDRDPVLVTRDTYDRIADRFLARTRKRDLVRLELEPFAAALCPGGRVLDVGAGPGFDSIELERRGLAPIAVDLSRGMLEVGRADYPVSRAQCDMRALPIASGTMDGVWANASLLHLSREDAAVALAEFRRVLVRGGLLHVSVKRGEGAGIDTARYGEPRWFTWWDAVSLDVRLSASGFEIVARSEREGNPDSWLVRRARSAGG